MYKKDLQYYKFSLYGFLKNLQFFDPFMILFLRYRGLDFVQIGTLYAIREIVINIMEIPSGFIADVFGRKRAMIICFIAYIISFLVFYVTQDFWLFAAAFFFFGIGEAFRSGTHKAMILGYLRLKNWEQWKTDYYGHTRGWSQTGAAVSSLISAVLVFSTGRYEIVFLFSTIPYFLDLVLISTYPSCLNRDAGDDAEETVDHSEQNKLKEEFQENGLMFIKMVTSFSTFRRMTLTTLYNCFYKSAKDYLQPMLAAAALSLPFFMDWENTQRTAVLMGLIYFLLYFASTFAARKAGSFQKRFKTPLFSMNLLLTAGTVLGIAGGLVYHFQLGLIGAFLFTGVLIIQNIRRPIALGYLSDQFDRKIMATALSTESQLQTIITAILAPALGFFADKFGVGPALTGISVFILIIGMILSIGEKKKT